MNPLTITLWEYGTGNREIQTGTWEDVRTFLNVYEPGTDHTYFCMHILGNDKKYKELSISLMCYSLRYLILRHTETWEKAR